MANLRDVIFDRLKVDSVLNGLGINEASIFNSNDADTPQVRPMMVLRWGATSLGVGTVNERSLQVWVHDAPTDYTRIDSALERVRASLAGLYGASTGTAGKFVSQIDWAGDSDDLTDDIQNTVTRYSSFTIVGSAV